jgi:predicted nuclease with TOPRIM domain
MLQGSVELIERAETTEAQLRVSDEEIQRLRAENKRLSERVVELKKGNPAGPGVA